MTIRRLVQLLLGGLMVLAAVVAAVIAVARVKRERLVELERRRFLSYELAEELRHSSDDLTRFVRSYVATGDPKYERYYHDVLAIRNGAMPLPEHYERIYWDLLLDTGAPPRPSGAPQSLVSQMRAAGFTPGELAQLEAATRASDALTATEDDAVHAMKGEFRDAAGRFTRRGRPDPVLAARLVNDSAYNHQKALIMRPIDAFLGQVEQRSANELDAFHRQTVIAVLTGDVALGAFLLLVLISYPLLRLRVLEPVRTLQAQTRYLAADLDRLATATKRIAEGESSPSFTADATPIGSRRRDEIGELARLHDSMRERLQATGEAIATITGALSAARHDAEQRLVISEQRFSSVFRESPVPLLVADLETGRLVAANSAFLALCQAAHLDDVLGRTTTELGFWAGNDDRLSRITQPLNQERRVELVQLPFRRPDGELRTVEAAASFYEMDGKRYAIGSAVDVTDRLRAEQERRRAEAQYRELFEGVRDVVFTLSPDGAITMLSPAFEAITGLPPGEWIGKPFAALIHDEDAERAARQLRASLAGQPAEAPPLRIRTKTGWSLADIRTAPRIENGRLTGVFGIARDVSERAGLEEQLRQSQKMQALGTLAGGIAHDFNNILTAINGNAELALEEAAPDDPARVSIQEIRKAGQRAKDLVRQILIFSRRQETRRQVIDLGPVVEEALRLLRTSLPKTMNITSHAAPALPRVLADGTQVHQIVMNLGTNAGHAMGERGTLSVDLARVVLTEGAVAGLAAGPYVRLTVRDTGVGMSPEVLGRIFEPFFTTKGTAGTGLGLSVVHGIMRDHEGAISVESEVGKGTAFHLHFPAATAPASAAEAASAARSMGAGQHVMLVDDEEGLVFVVSRVLTRLGYRCTGFTSPHEALQAFRTTPREFHAVITDLSMPGMGGLELIDAIRAIRADVPIAISSGTPDENARAKQRGVEVRIQKPATIDELAAAVAGLFAGASG